MGDNLLRSKRLIDEVTTSQFHRKGVGMSMVQLLLLELNMFMARGDLSHKSCSMA